MEVMNRESEDFTEACILLSVGYDGKQYKAYLLFYNPTSGKIVKIYDPYRHKPYFLTDYTPEDMVSKFRNIITHRGFSHLEVVEKYHALLDKKIHMTKIVARDPLSVGGSRNSMREILKGHAWEAHIKYHNCYIYDTGLIPGMLYRLKNGKIEPVKVTIPDEVSNRILPKYPSNKKIKEEVLSWLQLLQAPIPEIKRLAIDIEVYSPVQDRIPSPDEAKYEVIAVSLASSDGLKKVLLLERENMKNDEKITCLPGNVEINYFKNEKKLLEETFNYLRQYPLILTFNGDNFDLPYLRKRAQKLGIKEEDIPIIRRQDGTYITDRIHVDLYRFFNNKAMQVYAFNNSYQEAKTLDVISKALLGEGKVVHLKAISEMSYGELAEYSFKDAELTLKLTTFNDNLVIKLIILMMRISKATIDDITRTGISAWIKNMLYYEHRKRNYLIPLSEELTRYKGQTVTRAIIKGKKYLGAIVIDPVSGIFFNVIVLDFASLYPSVIKRWNLSYETVRCPHPECRDNIIPGTSHWVCKKRIGLSSFIIGLLRDFRVYIYKVLANTEKNPELRQQYKVVQRALKVFINASYGVFGAETFSLYCPPVAESTTALGRHAILSSLKKAKDLGLVILYGDTDSLFIWNPSQEQIEELMKWSREYLEIDLDIDKKYKWIAFSGRKKNYLGIYIDGKVDIKGLVGKKRNTPEFVKKLFSDVIAVLSKVENVEQLEEAKDEIRKITYENYKKLKNRLFTLDELAFRVTLTKSLKSYTKTTPQHVKAARQLARFGKKIEVGDIISFVKTRDNEGVKAIQLARIDEIDDEKYIEYIRTTAEQILESLGASFEEIMGKIQLSLFP